MYKHKVRMRRRLRLGLSKKQRNHEATRASKAPPLDNANVSVDFPLSTQSKPSRSDELLFQRMVMAELGMACTMHHAGDRFDLLGLLCELRA